mmetsp:Transcript_13626/g.38798  ORF Transcript_13626/g.38798 Transcript_13626/m.38798 type:complete len:169 (-) Transcript_13626:166-672(-)
MGGTRRLNALGVPFAAAAWWAHGLAFELRAKARTLSLVAIEAGAIAQGAQAPLGCVVRACEGTLAQQLCRPSAWGEVGRGLLVHRRAARLELSRPVVLRAHVPQCLYIYVDAAGPGSGIIFGAPCAEGVSAEDVDMRISAGHFSTDLYDFSAGGFYPFSGRLEYALLE